MEQRLVKINFIGFWNDFDVHHNLFYLLLSQRYRVEISEQPDFVFCGPLGKPYDYMKYDCVRIFFTGEYLSPDFILFDYAMAFDYITFGDRYYRYPLSLYRNVGEPTFRTGLTEEEATAILQKKRVFCNYIYGHRSQTEKREALLAALNTYKTVDCAGTYANNQPSGKPVYGADKFAFLQISKFTVAAESVEYPGFTTEKIIHAFNECSVPIYYGDPLVSRMFNAKAFVNCADYASFADVVDRVREIDTNDRLYLEMLMEPIEAYPGYVHDQFEGVKSFLYNIFDQDPQDAFRRMRYFRSAEYERFAREYMKLSQSTTYKLYKKLGKL